MVKQPPLRLPPLRLPLLKSRHKQLPQLCLPLLRLRSQEKWLCLPLLQWRNHQRHLPQQKALQTQSQTQQMADPLLLLRSSPTCQRSLRRTRRRS